MPLVVKELVVRAEVASAESGAGVTVTPPARPEIELRRLVERCVAEVLRELDRRQER